MFDNLKGHNAVEKVIREWQPSVAVNEAKNRSIIRGKVLQYSTAVEVTWLDFNPEGVCARSTQSADQITPTTTHVKNPQVGNIAAAPNFDKVPAAIRVVILRKFVWDERPKLLILLVEIQVR